MAKYGLVIDCNKCVGCYNCFLTCRDEFCGNDYPGYAAAQPMEGQSWIKVVEKERGTYPEVKTDYYAVPCMHCENAACIKAAENGAVYRRPDGIVMIDPEKAKGQKQIVTACPYRAISWNEALQLPQKCIMCAHMLDKGEAVPRCVESCPSGALVFGDMDDPNSAIGKLLKEKKTEVLHPEYGLKEKVQYIDLPKKFVCGTVIDGKKDECAVGVEVTLGGAGQSMKSVTDGFGDFEFDGLAENTEYTVKVSGKELKAVTKMDVYLGEIVI
jgi:Fe-S-cluster-containing dehydrogenase component